MRLRVAPTATRADAGFDVARRLGPRHERVQGFQASATAEANPASRARVLRA